jgi:hypothetical protein
MRTERAHRTPADERRQARHNGTYALAALDAQIAGSALWSTARWRVVLCPQWRARPARNGQSVADEQPALRWGDMTGADHPSDVGPIVYVDRSDVHEGCLNELKVDIHALVAFVDAHQPQMAMYGIYLDDQAHRMTVVSVHPNSTSLERHIKLGAPEFRKLAPYIDLREIEVF